MPNRTYIPTGKSKGKPRKDLIKEQILLAMRHTLSNRAAARYLNVSYIHYKMWAKQYNSDIKVDPNDPNSLYKSLFVVHLNPHGKGIPKFMTGNAGRKSKWNILDVIEGRISPTHFKPEAIKKKMIDEGVLKEECSLCGFNERRINDYKIPLILNFKDNNPNHYGLGNIRFLCYNCFFLNIGNIFNKQDIKQLETHNETYGTTKTKEKDGGVIKAIDFQLDDYQKEQLEKLGLYEPPKPDDGTEFISRS